MARASCPCESHGRDARATTAPKARAIPVFNKLPIIFAILVQFLASPVIAADKLEVDLIPAALRVRGEAPIPVQARFRWNGTYILEGHLEVELHEANRVLARYRSGDLALTTGEQTFHILLPPCPGPFSDSQVEAQTKFVTAKQVFDLGYSILFMPTMQERSFVLGWCNTPFGGDQQSSAQQRFLFERFAPPEADTARKLLVTSVVRLAPEDLPAQPLAYTSFDVMVMSADAFKQAREGQLRALARWVKGGGSVCVFVTGGLREHHLSFLNGLAGSSAVDPAFAADGDGNLVAGQKKISRLYSGVGRCVVVAASSATDPSVDQTELRRAIAFLWKFRAKQVQAIAETDHWKTEVPTNPQPQPQPLQRNPRFRQPNIFYANQSSYSVQPTSLGSQLMGQLMPRTVRLIPFSALMTTLGLFLLMIGPVDYFVLGWLRRRRYTWVLFPAMSLAFMIATVLMANYFLGQRDQRRSLTIVDLDQDGTALRWNRFELVFAARDKQVVTELKDALWAPIDLDAMPVLLPNNQGYVYPNGNQPYGYAYRRPNETRETGPPWYEGVVPVHFRTSQSINQWQPKLNRIFSFEPPPALLLPNWPQIEAAWPDLQKIQAELSAGKIFANVCSLSGSNSASFTDKGHDPILNSSIIEGLSKGDSTGLLSIVSQVSPTGGGNFEDAQGMDAAGGDSLLAIVTQTGDDIVVYRRFFHGK